ncbi:GTPase, G3E family [Dethiosulfatibacter aminovorans DSM 17477]|uniref:GTPase, G3E family n=1 Tax=Dethiosulfatibacter aminovorans DSM 17477 TaxID=1121476 RepID=A0A1M6J7N6_9FIRM|nr:GTP-binding protein [Dethiosulfatibacter aminovorans]SHJ42692.1 GTPase, G3E family [Dethiosulfatibacter aminovorans DSM 17477]
MKLVLITGFLGSGKTTFLTNLLRDFKDEKVGVIMNEFGEKGIDGTLIQKNGIDLMELNNGSIFCACIKDNFIKALAEMTRYDFEYVIVEASGLADPSNIETILGSVNKIAEKEYDYSGSVCIVDSLYFLQQLQLLPALTRQIQYSSSAIVNKTDLQSKDKINEIEVKLLELNNNINIYKTVYCDTDIKELLDNLSPVDYESQDTTNTRENRPKTLVLKTDETVDYKGLSNFIDDVKDSTFRMKGFVNTEKGLFEVSAVNSQLRISPWDKSDEDTNLVIISSVGIKIISVVTNSWRKHLNIPISI